MPHITFIHGISNKPPEDKLLKIWLDALSDNSLGNNDGINPGTFGISTSMIYWADVLYGKPLEASAHESVESLESTETAVIKDPPAPEIEWLNDISAKEADIIMSLIAKFMIDAAVKDDVPTMPADTPEGKLERIPLPWVVKKLLMRVLLKDVHHYSFNYEFSPRPGSMYKVQDEIRRRMVTKLKEVDTDLHIVISHSMGTMMIYDCLKRVADCPAIDCLMTIGSPLGIDEVQDCLTPGWTTKNGFPEKVKGNWVNVYDVLDPVTGFDGNIANDFKKNGEKVIKVIKEQNEGSWRHDITKYLKRPKLRKALSEMLNL